MHNEVAHYVVLALAAFLAGAINSIAGGGTILTFPALLAVGVSNVVANGTSTIALTPASLSALWGYRKEGAQNTRDLAKMAVPSFLGGLIGALLVIWIGNKLFGKLVPWLVLGATALFIVQDPIRRWLDRKRAVGQNGEAGIDDEGNISVGGLIFQFFVAIYGGFFGAGIGILMLASLGMMGMRDIHRMNRIKNFSAACINGIASATFAWKREIDWPIAGLMTIGAIAGGYLGADMARRVGQANVRKIVISIGLAIGIYMLLKQMKLVP